MQNPLRKLFVLGSCAAFTLALPIAASAIRINEIRIDNSGTDSDEYFELAGEPNSIHLGLAYVVIGDGSGGSGVLEHVSDFGGFVMEADGFKAFHDSDGPAAQCSGYDSDTELNFENSDNVTHLLVVGYDGTPEGTDLDTDDDGTLDIVPWSAVVDCVALIETVGSGDLVYCDNQVGPDGTFVPGHVYYCNTGGGWQIGAFSPVCTDDTPGAANNTNDCTPISVDPNSWGTVKSKYRE